MRRALLSVAVVALVGAGAAWWLTAPDNLPASALDGVTGDAGRGQVLFAAAGCGSCHIAPGAEETDSPVLSGGRRFATQFGTFVAPNISPSPQGIGDWSDYQVVNAVMRGVDDEGRHLYPAFPWNAYNKATVQDVADIVAYIRTLPPSDAGSLPHELSFPFDIRQSLGGWKLLFEHRDWVLQGDLTPEQERGRYLVEALGHCGECHTPRNALGGLDRSAWLAGAPDPAGKGRVPNITPAGLDWSEDDIVTMLQSGFTPDYDVVGGEMAQVVRNTAQLSDEDRAAIAAYLKAVPPVESTAPQPGAGDSTAEEGTASDEGDS
ncbi:Putative diheme cytochrome c-553 [Rubellimicrobium mesophilum DSM 19309]|uniref:Putative diheme cytochrome c-553 n=1 Tax=Rubellimicrobium mesophilum DSM 19309 TaxID=442562 RepID=A0A017HHG6_9RHOB|nr:cytochrome c [Rubellimicrobium mesophilum]EYD73563.1 Putative diheme cytochrome c-553 [Rubellimicrobium mesophilum DSM 19309]